jgi:hypothetical protein
MSNVGGSFGETNAEDSQTGSEDGAGDAQGALKKVVEDRLKRTGKHSWIPNVYRSNTTSQNGMLKALSSPTTKDGHKPPPSSQSQASAHGCPTIPSCPPTKAPPPQPPIRISIPLAQTAAPSPTKASAASATPSSTTASSWSNASRVPSGCTSAVWA